MRPPWDVSPDVREKCLFQLNRCQMYSFQEQTGSNVSRSQEFTVMNLMISLQHFHLTNCPTYYTLRSCSLVAYSAFSARVQGALELSNREGHTRLNILQARGHNREGSLSDHHRLFGETVEEKYPILISVTRQDEGKTIPSSVGIPNSIGQQQ